MAENKAGYTWYEKLARIIVIIAAVAVVVLVAVNMTGIWPHGGARPYVFLTLGIMLAAECVGLFRERRKVAIVCILASAAVIVGVFLKVVL